MTSSILKGGFLTLCREIDYFWLFPHPLQKATLRYLNEIKNQVILI